MRQDAGDPAQAALLERAVADGLAGATVQPSGGDDAARPRLLQAWVARKYFLERKLKREIADELGISRFKVARLLRSGIETGIVRISIDVIDPEGIDGQLSADLQDAYGLRRAVVVHSLPEAESTMQAVAKAAAQVLAESLEPGDVLGISWGRALSAMVDELPPLPPCPIVQIAGGSGDWDLSVNAVEIVRRAGARSGGRVYALHAPLTVADPELAAALRSDPSVSRTLQMFPRITKVVVGIGSWKPPGSTIRDIIDEADRQLLESRGVVGDACGCFVTETGEVVSSPLDERLLAFRAADLRRVPEVIAVTHGRERALAVRSVLRTGLVTTLVTDADVARDVLAMPRPSSSSGRRMRKEPHD